MEARLGHDSTRQALRGVESEFRIEKVTSLRG